MSIANTKAQRIFLNLILVYSAITGGLRAQADTLIAASGKERVRLLELFSSEGCSSCPPADQWVSNLKDRPGLFKTFVPVVFHVDYWNYLGWNDNFSTHAMTQRQIDIAHQWSSANVYTPAVVLDGKEWREWRDTKSIAASTEKNTGLQLSILKSAEGKFKVKVEGPQSGEKYTLHMAQLGLDINSIVTEGENSGRTLKHNFVVLNWQSKALAAKSKNGFEESFQFSSIDKKKASRLAIAAWIEKEGQPTALQATGGYL